MIRSPWLAKLRPVASPRLRLVCFPYAGGSAAAYRTWKNGVPPDVEILAVQLPGRGPRIREPPVSRMEPLLEALGPALSGAQGAPLAFFGHSMGALMAFELCRLLRRTGGPAPAHLFLSGREPPQHARNSEPVRAMSDADLVARLKRFGGTPDEVLENQELLELVLPSLRADLDLLAAWRDTREPALDVPATVLGGRDDAMARAHLLEGWRDCVKEPLAIHLFPGGHFFIHTEEAAVLQVISTALEGIR